MKTIKEISCILTFSYIYWYMYTSGIFLYGSLFFCFSPEFIFIFGFISLFIYGLVKKLNSFDCIFSYSIDGVEYKQLGEPFAAKKGKWIGAKVGLFALRNGKVYESGYADVDWFRIDK